MAEFRLLPRLAFVILLAFTLVHAGISRESGADQKPAVLWRDPGNVESLDLRYGLGGPEGQPEPPFRFKNEDLSGTRRKINVTDAGGDDWNVKFGGEVRSSVFCSRLLWACGYVAQPEYFIGAGHVLGARDLSRAHSVVSSDGLFKNARFQSRTGPLKFLKKRRWSWDENPFIGTPELQGLKILTMLVSNWDAKNTNLGVFEDAEAGEPRELYAVTDWGNSLGKWGRVIVRSVDNCSDFTEQTPHFVKGVVGGNVLWGWNGVNRGAVTENITVSDVQWLMRYLGRISDDQLRDALSASGMTSIETNCYARALRARINALRQVAASPSPALAGD